ncbi:MAG: RpiB/LacA/LacB family sugar-phosphate isomerase [Gemmatimonadaceae bacterium]
MRIAVAADHAGFERKNEVADALRALGHDVSDLGTYDTRPVDYPDFAEALGLAIMKGRAERGVLVCGSGVGAAVAINKMPGIRASICHDSYSAHQGVEHDDMNVLVLGGRVVGPEVAKELARVFAAARFSGEERHLRRLAKMRAIEERYEGAGREGDLAAEGPGSEETLP